MGSVFATLLACFLVSASLLVTALVFLCLVWGWESWSQR